MDKHSSLLDRYATPCGAAVAVVGLLAANWCNYLLFHSLAEIFIVVVAFTIFVLAWNSRRVLDNNYLLFLGISCLFIGGLHVVHALAYKGMGVFPHHDPYLSVRAWIAVRVVTAAAFLLAPLFLDRRLRLDLVFLAWAAVTAVLLVTLFTGIFPVCFVEGRGLTPFKKVSEYVIAAMFLASLIPLYKKRDRFDPQVFRLIAAAVLLSFLAEIPFAIYHSVFDFLNVIGHFLVILASYLMYRAIIVTGLRKPHDLLFRELARSERALRETSEELARSNKELDHFCSVVSHDLQAPLRTVTSYMQLLESRYRSKLDANAEEYIRFAVDGAARMRRLIEDLLTYSRVTTQAKPLEPTDCSQALEQALVDLQAAIQESNATVEHDPLPTVQGDTTQLVQLFQNLIGNAIKFRRDEPPRIHVAARPANGTWQFSVSDNGIGIEPQYAERVFAMFERLHSADEYPGTGIGLAICDKIVDRHGGRIWVESELGKGSTFFFTLSGGPS